jgi:hypothetical protein
LIAIQKSFLKHSLPLIASLIAILVMIYHLNQVGERYKELGQLSEIITLFIYSRTTKILMIIFLISAIIVDRVLNKQKFVFLNILGNVLAVIMLIYFSIQ